MWKDPTQKKKKLIAKNQLSVKLEAVLDPQNNMQGRLKNNSRPCK